MKTKAPNADRTTEPSSTRTPRRPTLGVWLYAVTNSRGRETSGLPSGVADEPVRLIDTDGLTAAVGTVDLLEFGEEALRRKLEDLDWLAGAARAHDRVINALTRGGATVPVGLATVFADDDNVRAMLGERHANLSAALSRLARRTEWGVKAYAYVYAGPAYTSSAGDGEDNTDGSRDASDADAAKRGAAAAEEGSGTAFLKRKRAALARQRAAAKVQAERVAHIHERLNRLSVSSRLYAPQDPALTGRHEHMLLNGAYLVDDDGLDAFRSAVTFLDAEGRRDGVHVELTGPWPAYSFTAEGLADG